MSVKSPNTTQIERGGYSSIVYVDGDLIVAEDDVGTIISEGSNAATGINAAIDSLPAYGGLIFLKDRFTIDATITIDTEGVILMGDSWRNSGLKATTDIPLITITTTGTKSIIEKMYLEGANDVAKTNNHGIFFSGATSKYDHQLRDLFIVYTYDGVNGDKVGYVNLDNVRCQLCKHDGIHITGDATCYNTIYGTNIYLKDYGHTGLYTTYLMGSKIVNIWLEGNLTSFMGLRMDHAFMNWFTNVDCEGHTDNGAYITNDDAGSSITAGWFAGNGENGIYAHASKEFSFVQCYFVKNEKMGFYSNASDRMLIKESYAIANSQDGVNNYSGFVLNDTEDNILSGLIAYDGQATKTQKYGIQSLGTSDYNIVNGCNCRSNATGGISLVGSNNVNTDNIT